MVKGGVIRCAKCKSYVNPWVRWEADGRGWECNLCNFKNETEKWYMERSLQRNSALGGTIEIPYEQTFGTVDVEVGKDYCIRDLQRPLHLFALDETSGMLEAGLEAVVKCAEALAERFREDGDRNDQGAAEYPQRMHPRLGFFTFGNVMRFYKYKSENDVAVDIVTDVEESPFAALPSSTLCFDVLEEMDKLKNLVDKVPWLVDKTLANSKNSFGPCTGAAIEALYDSLAASGGKAYLLASARPRFGKLRLRDRDIGNNYKDGSAEVSMFSPLKETSGEEEGTAKIIDDKIVEEYYEEIARGMAKAQVCLDMYVCPGSPNAGLGGADTSPQEYADSATLGLLCTRTGGTLHMFSRSDSAGVTLADGIISVAVGSVTKPMGNDVVVKVRTSRGIQVKEFLTPVGILHQEGGSCEVEVASLDSGKSLCVVIEHDNEKTTSQVYFQCATLYTSTTGRRIVRVSTLAIPTSSEVQDVFRASDQDAVCAHLSRKAMEHLGFSPTHSSSSSGVLDYSAFGGRSLLKAREFLINNLVSILACYRKYAHGSQKPQGQLILPEALKLVPLFILSMLKSRALQTSCPRGRVNKSAPPYPRVDERAERIYRTCYCTPEFVTSWAHPNLFDVLNMGKDAGLLFKPRDVVEEESIGQSHEVDEERVKPFVKLPPTILPSMTSMNEGGLYLMDAMDVLYLFICRSCPLEVLSDLFNVSSLSAEAEGSHLPKVISDGSDLGHRLNSVICELRRDRCVFAPLEIIVQGRTDCSVNEAKFLSLLVDDSTVHEVSYVDFLCVIHRKIQHVILDK